MSRETYPYECCTNKVNKPDAIKTILNYDPFLHCCINYECPNRSSLLSVQTTISLFFGLFH